VTTSKIQTEPAQATTADLVDLADVLSHGFPHADLIPVVLGQVPGQVMPATFTNSRGTSFTESIRKRAVMPREVWAQTEGPMGRLRLSCGTVEIQAVDEARAERARNAQAARQARPITMTEWDDDAQGYVNKQTGEIWGAAEELPPRVRGRISEWSGKSRANMIRRMAATDWRPMLAYGVAPMVTVSYPGPWHAFAPTRKDVGRHLEAFKEAYRKDFCAADRLRVMGAWKVEYQRRGAPHVHLLLPIPRGLTLPQYRDWVAATWSGIVWADRGGDFLRLLEMIGHDGTAASLIADEHYRRNRLAGTAVDLAEGLRCRDPRRIALYFLGHSLAHAKDGGKEYQHRLPVSYAGRAGRWWGVWGLVDSTSTVHLDVATWWAIRDALASYAMAEGRVAFQGGRMFGGWLAVPDGPETLLRVLETLDTGS